MSKSRVQPHAGTNDASAFAELRKRLEASENRYRNLFEGSKDMIFIASPEGILQEMNPAAVETLGYKSREDMHPTASVEILFDNKKHWRVFKRQIDRDGFVKDFETLFKKEDGYLIHCLVSGNAVYENGKRINGYLGIAKDITARTDAIRNYRRRHSEMRVLNSIAFAMNRSQDLNPILMTALKKLLEVLRLKSGAIFLIEPETASFKLAAIRGFPDGIAGEDCSIRLLDTLLQDALLEKETVLTPVPIFPLFKSELTSTDGNTILPLTCFLITAKERPTGFIALHVPPHRDLSGGQDFHLMGSLGNFLGGAIEKTILLHEIQRHQGELKALNASLFRLQENERRRIARELHDEAGQALTGIKFSLESIAKSLPAGEMRLHELFSGVTYQIVRTYEEIRRIAHRLHPALLNDLGLEPALDAWLKNISDKTDLHIDFRMVGFDRRIESGIENTLYRISQEVVNNTLKHAKATVLKLSITKGYPNIVFLAEDDGVGFDLKSRKRAKQTMGLISMKERVAHLGGTFRIRSKKGAGTRFRIEIPTTGLKNGRD